MARFGDQLSDTLKKLGAPANEVEYLRLQGNKLTDVAAQVAGWTGNGGMISSGAIEFPVDVIQTVNLDAPSTAIVFATIPNRFNHLRLMATAKAIASSAFQCQVRMVLNDDTTANNYLCQQMGGADGTAPWEAHSSRGAGGYVAGPTISGSTASASGFFDPFVIDIPNSREGAYKGGVWTHGHWGGGSPYTFSGTFWYTSPNPIKKISLTVVDLPDGMGSAFSSGTVISLIGIV